MGHLCCSNDVIHQAQRREKTDRHREVTSSASTRWTRVFWRLVTISFVGRCIRWTSSLCANDACGLRESRTLVNFFFQGLRLTLPFAEHHGIWRGIILGNKWLPGLTQYAIRLPVFGKVCLSDLHFSTDGSVHIG